MALFGSVLVLAVVALAVWLLGRGRKRKIRVSQQWLHEHRLRR